MSAVFKICFTCRKNISTKYYCVEDCDVDQISYLEKLKTCITNELIEFDQMEMCWLCVKYLKVAYKFRQTVLMAQEELKRCDTKSDAIIKFEGESDDFKNFSKDNSLKSETCSDSDSFTNTHDVDYTMEKCPKRGNIKNESLCCEYCSTLFTKHWQLRKHVARVHYEVRKFVCTYCNKEFKQSNHLKEHITSHTGEKNYSCPICEKRFQRLSSQRRHIRGHDAPPGHKTKRTPFLCNICGKSFPFSNGVQRHMRIHLGIKKFECSFCKRKFTQSTHLQVHMRTHTGEKPYICDTCGEKFSLKSCMLKHIHNRHVLQKMPILIGGYELLQNATNGAVK